MKELTLLKMPEPVQNYLEAMKSHPMEYRIKDALKSISDDLAIRHKQLQEYHLFSGFSRAMADCCNGIGDEISLKGNKDPFFIKEAISFTRTKTAFDDRHKSARNNIMVLSNICLQKSLTHCSVKMLVTRMNVALWLKKLSITCLMLLKKKLLLV